MSKFPDKLFDARMAAGLNQAELAEKVGVSRRSIFTYEKGLSYPHRKVLQKLSDALGVTVFYLTHDDCTDPVADREREDHLRMAREKFGPDGEAEAADLLDRNMAFFAGGDIPQENKDAFFDAIMTAYLAAKNEARRKYTPKSVKAAAEKKKK